MEILRRASASLVAKIKTRAARATSIQKLCLNRVNRCKPAKPGVDYLSSGTLTPSVQDLNIGPDNVI
jgi:hypothetical protein